MDKRLVTVVSAQPVQVRLSRPAPVVMAPAPPPVFETETIRGGQRSTETLDTSVN